MPVISEEQWNSLIHREHPIEFDWVGIDKHQRLGIFSSYGSAYIPEKVLTSFKDYLILQELVNNMPTTTTAIVATNEKGDFHDWLLYSKKGFFSFDFQDVHRIEKYNRYDLIAKPAKPVTLIDIKNYSRFINIISFFDLEFQDDILFENLIKEEIHNVR